ncbi:hypothetical protein C5167_024753 [Papaver somniferum]|uniref:S-protein homolog n=1 Tax=Papaver somniferum TaxID=3469 RepID=A0A4Y7JPG6_PAPSO|nr:hypothetical protein C5167_024753 [Papaver somniferum]
MARFFTKGELFLVVLTILFWFSSVTDGLGLYWEKTEVVIKNDISPNTTLTFHCKSGDEDLGEQSLASKDSWSFRFFINFFDTTLYWCNFRWVDENVATTGVTNVIGDGLSLFVTVWSTVTNRLSPPAKTFRQRLLNPVFVFVTVYKPSLILSAAVNRSPEPDFRAKEFSEFLEFSEHKSYLR